MSKGNNRLEAITRQNELLKQQNELLREQIELLKKSSTQLDANEIFVENIDRDEMRNGFLVTSHRKKLWNVQVGLINEFARICKKHNLRWFAFYGTLLGAVRHKGFIPWDDDSDVVMFRDDYEKFKKIAQTEVHPPYFVDDWANYRREDSKNSLLDSEANFPLIPREQERFVGWPFCYPSIKFRDSRTAMIAYPERPDTMNQGIFIDIFPLDIVPPFTQKTHALNFKVAKELFISTAYPDKVREAIDNDHKFILNLDELKKFLGFSHKQKVTSLENFLGKTFSTPEHVNQLRDLVLMGNNFSYDTADFKDVVYLPFEKIEVPAPAGWENILKVRYGDWRKLVYTHTHAFDHTVDFSYEEYFQKAAKKTLVTDENNKPSILIEEQNNS